MENLTGSERNVIKTEGVIEFLEFEIKVQEGCIEQFKESAENAPDEFIRRTHTSIVFDLERELKRLNDNLSEKRRALKIYKEQVESDNKERAMQELNQLSEQNPSYGSRSCDL